MRRIVLALLLPLTFAPAPFCATLAQSAPAAAPAKRPMTFEDMMQMKRLGETAVSADGRWLAYSVTTVHLAQNSKTAELWLQRLDADGTEAGKAQKLGVAQPGDSGPQFAPGDRHILFLSSRSGSRQVWLADFDPATGAASNPRQLTSIATGADNALWSPDGNSIVFTSFVYPDCPAITTADAATGNRCNAGREAARAASMVKARIFTHLLYRHWDHFTGDKRSHLFLVSVANGTLRDLTPNDPHDIPPFSLEGSGCGCSFAPDSKELAYTEKDVPVPAISTNADIFTLDLTRPAAKPVKVSTSPGGDFNPAYSPDGKWLAWRSQARAGYESDKFRLVVYDRRTKKIRDVLPNFDRWVDEFAWAPDSKSLFLAAGNAGQEPVFETTLDGRLAELPGAGDFGGLLPLPGSRAVIADHMTVEAPGEVVAIVPASGQTGPRSEISPPDGLAPILAGQIHPLTHLNDALLAQLDRPPMEPFWFTAQDGTRL
ncbi:MAG: TolB family protein, partial [Terracidiphilus sp.]